MKRFMLLPYGSETPTPETRAAWGAWGESVADRVVDHGGFLPAAREFTGRGASDLAAGADAITGYCILNAETFEEASAIARRAPFVAAVRVYEIA